MSLASEQTERRAAERARWAAIALTRSADELHAIDAEASAAFAAEAERVADLLDPQEPRLEQWGTWSR